MADVTFEIPDDVLAAFNATFSVEHRTAVITGLMREAVERRLAPVRRSRQQHQDAIHQILAMYGSPSA